jgi:two-component system OmpR family response regulator
MDPVRILLVDDEALFVEALAKILRRHGMEVLTAGDGAGALALFDSHGPQVVVLDLRMPGMNGMEVLREMKRHSPTTPVIVLTGHGTVESGQEALRLGAFDFEMKPARVGHLLDVIQEALRSRALAVQAAEGEGGEGGR